MVLNKKIAVIVLTAFVATSLAETAIAARPHRQPRDFVDFNYQPPHRYDRSTQDKYDNYDMDMCTGDDNPAEDPNLNIDH